MPENEIIAEIHRYREELAQRFDFDIHKLGAYLQEQQEISRREGRKIVDLSKKDQSAVVREEPPRE